MSLSSGEIATPCARCWGTWDVQAALPPPRDETWPFLAWHHDEELNETIHDIWCRSDMTQPWTIQLMIADSQDNQWLFRRLPSIHLSIATVGDITPEGIPYLVPEIQLLYKAKRLRPKDEADFRQTLSVLSRERRTWLRAALPPGTSPAYVVGSPDR
jgi:hypothetical protein